MSVGRQIHLVVIEPRSLPVAINAYTAPVRGTMRALLHGAALHILERCAEAQRS